MLVKLTFASTICLLGFTILIQLDSMGIICLPLSVLLLLLVTLGTRRSKISKRNDESHVYSSPTFTAFNEEIVVYVTPRCINNRKPRFQSKQIIITQIFFSDIVFYYRV